MQLKTNHQQINQFFFLPNWKISFHLGKDSIYVRFTSVVRFKAFCFFEILRNSNLISDYNRTEKRCRFKFQQLQFHPCWVLGLINHQCIKKMHLYMISQLACSVVYFQLKLVKKRVAKSPNTLLTSHRSCWYAQRQGFYTKHLKIGHRKCGRNIMW